MPRPERCGRAHGASVRAAVPNRVNACARCDRERKSWINGAGGNRTPGLCFVLPLKQSPIAYVAKSATQNVTHRVPPVVQPLAYQLQDHPQLEWVGSRRAACAARAAAFCRDRYLPHTHPYPDLGPSDARGRRVWRCGGARRPRGDRPKRRKRGQRRGSPRRTAGHSIVRCSPSLGYRGRVAAGFGNSPAGAMLTSR